MRWLCCLVVFAPWVSLPAAERPNILFLLADDMRAESIGALGDAQIKTPNLDRLVERSFVFRNAYCLGGNSPAVCQPSRNMILSGNAYFRWAKETVAPHRRGMLAPPDGPNFARTFREAGYETYHHGKRGNTAPQIERQFEHHAYLMNDEAERRCGEPGAEIVDAALTFLANRQADRPFCMYLAFANPHDPRVAAERYLRQYDRESLSLPGNMLPVHPFDNGELTIRDELLAPMPRTPEAIRQIWHEYYATMTGLDNHIGRLLTALSDRQLIDNTVIVFSADQGISIGSHGLLGKQNLYDHAMKSPLTVAGPGIPRGASEALVYLFDIFPTLCELAGVPVPAGIDGVSQRSVMLGEKTSVREELFLAYRDVQRAVRDERWKLIRYPAVDRTQLFDLAVDPLEMRDLAGGRDHEERVAAMLVRLAHWQQHFGDPLDLKLQVSSR